MPLMGWITIGATVGGIAWGVIFWLIQRQVAAVDEIARQQTLQLQRLVTLEAGCVTPEELVTITEEIRRMRAEALERERRIVDAVRHMGGQTRREIDKLADTATANVGQLRNEVLNAHGEFRKEIRTVHDRIDRQQERSDRQEQRASGSR